MSVHKASVVYSVPLTTVRDRVDGRVHIDTVKSGPPPLFNQEEEVKFIPHIKKISAYSYDYSRAETINIASDYAVYCHKCTKEQPLTNRWYYNFMSRSYNEVNLVKPRSVEAARASAATKDKVDSYFEELNAGINKYHLGDKPQCIFNIDEKVIN
jgi:hypothetical protein